MDKPGTCVCGSGNSGEILYADCCGQYLDANKIAATAETLMRSRYTAYTMQREDYLLSTWHHSTRPPSLGLNKDAKDAGTKWLGLEIKRHELNSEKAIVEFIARYKVGGGRAERLHEISNFVFEDQRWFYVDGEIK